MDMETLEKDIAAIKLQNAYIVRMLEDLTLTFKGNAKNKNMAKDVMGIMRGMVETNPDIAKSPMMKDMLTKMSEVIK